VGRTQRRDPQEQCSTITSDGEGRREGGPVRSGAAEQSFSPLSSSETVESTSIRRKLPPFAGRQWKRIFGRFTAMGELPTLPARRIGDPGAREMHRGGELTPSASPSLGFSRPTHFFSSRKRPRRRKPARGFAWLVGASTGQPGGEYAVKKRDGAAATIHGRGSTARWVCSRVVSCCRIRPAASGPEKRESGISNRKTESRGRGLARSKSSRSPKAISRWLRAKGRREPQRDGKVTVTEKVGASFSVSETRPDHVGSVTSRGKAPRVADSASSSRRMRRSDLGDPGKIDACESAIETKGRRQGCQRLGRKRFVTGKKTPRGVKRSTRRSGVAVS
jgi:hypothetical protein